MPDPIVTRLPALARNGSRRALPFAIGVGLASLLVAVALAGCSSSATSPGATSPGATSTSSPQLASPTPTAESTQLQPPAAPTELSEWIVISDTDPAVPAYFKWTAAAGPISGYYFWIEGTYVDESGNPVTPPPAICGPSWETLPASPTTLRIDSVESEPQAYICAFNAAGTSPTVLFPVVSAP